MNLHLILFRNVIVVCGYLLFTNSSDAQPNKQTFKIQIDSLVQKIMIEHKIVGISIGIVKNNEIFYTKGYGSKDINISSPIDSLTNFLTCSISKLFTATAIMQLVEQGKIDIRKKLTDYVPDFVMKDSFGRVHIFEVKSVNVSSSILGGFDNIAYKTKLEELKKAYKQASKITNQIFYLPILREDNWRIFQFFNGIEKTLTKDQFVNFCKGANV